MKNKTTKETSRAQLRNGNSINFLSKEKMEKYGSSLQSLATAISLGLASERRMCVYMFDCGAGRARESGRGELLDQNKCLRKPIRGNWVQSAYRRFLRSTRVGLLWQQWPGWHAADRVAARASERDVSNGERARAPTRKKQSPICTCQSGRSNSSHPARLPFPPQPALNWVGNFVNFAFASAQKGERRKWRDTCCCLSSLGAYLILVSAARRSESAFIYLVRIHNESVYVRMCGAVAYALADKAAEWRRPQCLHRWRLRYVHTKRRSAKSDLT